METQRADKEKSPAERGALIFSVARDFQVAVETKYRNNHWHVLFTWALVKVLKAIPEIIKVGDFFELDIVFFHIFWLGQRAQEGLP